MSTLPPAVFLMGPTASGKTALALDLVERGPFEIISVDSSMIYRDMDIGTAKPTAEELARGPHRLINICDPSEAYSAAQFRTDALREMAEITAAGRIPLLVGGTMLYYKVLLDGLADMPDANPDVRARLEAEAKVEGWPAMHAKLAQVDAVTAARLKPNDSQRIQRALEVFEISGKPMSVWHAEQGPNEGLPYQVEQLAIAPVERATLHERIELRFNLMLEQGFLAEVEKLKARGDLHLGLPSMRSVGYRQAWEHLEGQYDLKEMQYRGVVATRQLAKRQFTWLRSFESVKWLETGDSDLAGKLLKSWETNLTLRSSREI